MTKFRLRSLKPILLLICYGLVDMMVGAIYSIQAPFYPQEAESKNATATEYGMVFSSAEVSQIILMPVIGTYVTKFGTWNAFVLSILTASSCAISFGFVQYINSRTWFIVTSIILRLINSFVTGVVSVGALVLINVVLTGAKARNMTIGQSSFGIGMSIGPAIGSLLFNLGGFTLPFAVLGATQLILGGITAYTLRTKESKIPPLTNDGIDFIEDKEIKHTLGYRQLLKIPEVLMYGTCTMVSAITSNFIMTLLEPHLRQFNLSTAEVGLVFLYYGVTFAIGSFSLAVICEKVVKVQYVTMTGAVCLLLSSILIGPATFLPFKLTFWMVILSLTLLPIGTSAIYSSANYLSVQAALRNGFPDDDLVSSLMSSLFLENLAIGSFIGPILAGILFDEFGFRSSTLFIIGFNSLISVSLIVFNCCRRNQTPRSLPEEKKPLLYDYNLNPRTDQIQNKDIILS